MLYCYSAELLADGGQIPFALCSIIVEDADFDQFMAVQVAADLLQYRVGQPLLTDGDDWIQDVGASPQGTSLVSVYIEHSVSLGKERILPSFKR